jgi:hypothetical protein
MRRLTLYGVIVFLTAWVTYTAASEIALVVAGGIAGP